MFNLIFRDSLIIVKVPASFRCRIFFEINLVDYEIRITFASMKDTKRYTNSYKCTNQVYNKAMKRAKKEKVFLANLIEDFVTKYSEGADTIYAFNTPTNHK